tara:strand:+ start:779 stop:1933 length:1155 start_codon:yes stop_codon:yes gene_type:complete
MTSKKKIYFLSGKKGGFDAMLPFLKLIKEKKDFNLKVILTDQHLNKKFGNTYKICARELGKKYIKKININQRDDKAFSRTVSMSSLLKNLSFYFKKSKPSLLIVYGDRAESLIASIVALNFDVPLCHFQGGDLSGNIDEKIRHSITKLSDLHLVSNKDSLARIMRMGENKSSSFSIGDSHIDSLKKVKIKKEKFNKIKKKYFLQKKYAVFLMHPDGLSNSKNQSYCRESLEALRKTNLQIICIYPCTDIGHQGIIAELKKFGKKLNRFKIFKTIEHEDFIILLKNCLFFLGNSSSGIIESSYLKIPFINIGNRQKGRLFSSNILHCRFKEKDILKMIQKSQSNSFKNKLNKTKLLYGDGKSYLKAYSIIKRRINSLSTYKTFYE